MEKKIDNLKEKIKDNIFYNKKKYYNKPNKNNSQINNSISYSTKSSHIDFEKLSKKISIREKNKLISKQYSALSSKMSLTKKGYFKGIFLNKIFNPLNSINKSNSILNSSLINKKKEMLDTLETTKNNSNSIPIKVQKLPKINLNINQHYLNEERKNIYLFEDDIYDLKFKFKKNKDYLTKRFENKIEEILFSRGEINKLKKKYNFIESKNNINSVKLKMENIYLNFIKNNNSLELKSNEKLKKYIKQYTLLKKF